MNCSCWKDIGLSLILAVVLLVVVNVVGNIAMLPNHHDENIVRFEKPAEEAAEAPAGESTEVAEAAEGAGDGAGDAAAGKKVFNKCKACHNAEAGAKNKVGPNLWGIIGKEKGTTEGFKYSEAITGLGGTWTAEDLDAFLTNPKDFAPGTKMAFGGLKNGADRANLIAWLTQQSD